MLDPFSVILWTLVGVATGLLFSWMPGFHVYNVIALLASTGTILTFIPQEGFPFFTLGAVVSFAYASTISTTYFSVADDTMIFMLFPTQRYLIIGRGHEATLLTLLGAFAASLILAASLPLMPYVLPILRDLFNPYIPLFLAALVLFMFMSEWLKKGDRVEKPGWRLAVAWSQALGGLFVFLASGVLGFIVMYTNVLPATFAYVRLTPLFLGFFGLPWVVLNILSDVKIERQSTEDIVEVDAKAMLSGVFGGALGGYIAAFFPLITGGMGALVAGHITSQRGDDTFIVSQGANRFIYYVGALLFLFLPAASLTRGSAAWLVSSIYQPKSYVEYVYSIGALLLASGISFIGSIFLSKAVAKIVSAYYKHVSVAVLILLLGIAWALTGFLGVFIMVVAGFIGFMSSLFNTRRSYCLGGLIFPVLLSMTGTAEAFAKLIGLW